MTLNQIVERLQEIQDRLPARVWCPVCELHTSPALDALIEPVAALQLEIERHLLQTGQL